jgi:hypothetical protein
MTGSDLRLAVCFFDQRVFYAVGEIGKPDPIVRIGSHEFNFSIADAFRSSDDKKIEGVYAILKSIKQEFSVSDLQVITLPSHECWATFPKIVQEDSAEREAHLGILMYGVERSSLDVTWYELSNRDYRLMIVRDSRIMNAFSRMGELVTKTAYNSECETGSKWFTHHRSTGNYMTICSYPGLISVSSYVLGKLRGATMIRFEVLEDLPFLWEFSAQRLRWMKGLHEQILFYGIQARHLQERLAAHLDSSADILTMDSLKVMGLNVVEETYNFELSQAFPAIIHAAS